MHRLIALLLPFLVVGNSLAHRHGTAAHQSPSQSRAHFHVGGSSHHSHDHHSHDHHESHAHLHDSPPHGLDENSAAEDSTWITPVEHDSDAVYVVGTNSLCTAPDRCGEFLESYFVSKTAAGLLIVSSSARRYKPPSLDCLAELPLYLRPAALRL